MQQHEIKARREAAGISQKELGERVGLKGQSARVLIAAYEAGSLKDVPSGARLDQIASALRVAERVQAFAAKEWAKFAEKLS